MKFCYIVNLISIIHLFANLTILIPKNGDVIIPIIRNKRYLFVYYSIHHDLFLFLMDLIPDHFDFSSICNEITQETNHGNQPNDKRENKSEIHFKAYLIFL